MTVTFEEVKKVIPTLQVEAIRKPKADGRMGCGLGYTVTVIGSHGAYRTTYNNSINAGDKAPDKMDILNCILSDANCYEYTQNLKDFCLEFGYDEYEDRTEANRAFEGCERAYEELSRIFTSEELKKLQELFQDY